MLLFMYGSRGRIWPPRLSVHVTGDSRMHASHIGLQDEAGGGMEVASRLRLFRPFFG